MNNTITEIKNALEGINSRISETKEQIRELEDKMTEKTSEEQNKLKECQKLRTGSETSGAISNTPHSNYRDPRRRREKERVWENFWRDYSWKFPQHGKGNGQSSPWGTKCPIQDKPKEKHTKAHTNQASKH